jgi:hypothetical protein
VVLPNNERYHLVLVTARPWPAPAAPSCHLESRPIAYYAKVLGRPLPAVRTDPNRFWMVLSGNASRNCFSVDDSSEDHSSCPLHRHFSKCTLAFRFSRRFYNCTPAGAPASADTVMNIRFLYKLGIVNWLPVWILYDGLRGRVCLCDGDFTMKATNARVT